MSAAKRIVVFISGRGSNMLALADACERGTINAMIAAVVSDDATAAGLDAAYKRGIYTCVVQRSDYADRERFEDALAQECLNASADLIALAGFMRILSGGFVRRFAGRIMNIHPSLLPEYAGLDTHQRALNDGATVHGCSVHFVTDRLDAGPIIIQDAVQVCANDTVETLSARVIRREHLIYPYAAGLFCAGRLEMDGEACRLDGKTLAAPLRLPEEADA